METTKTVSQIKRKTVISTLSLFFQSGYSAFLGLAANLVLTIILSPQIFGIYITVLSIISILNYFSDIGLAASLVQKNNIEEDDLKTAFTAQQILILTIIALGFYLTNFIRNFYKLPIEGIHLYWALLVSFFFSSLKTIPSVLLERKINFQKLVIVQITENTVFYLLVIVLGILNFGLNSFTIAVLFRSIIGLVLIYRLSFWQPAIGISYQHLKHLLSFGLPFQTNSLLALVKDDFITLFLGKILGFEKLGYIGWAKKWAESSIRIIMDNISRVMFPLFSRFQQEKEKLAKLLEKILYFQTAVILPTTTGIALVMDRFIQIIPKYQKWQPALPLFYLFCISAVLATFSTPFINFFNAVGKVKISFVFMIFWTALTWILTPLFINKFGVVGFPLSLLIVSATSLIVAYKAKTLIRFSLLKPVIPFAVATILMSLAVMIIKTIETVPLLTLFLTISGGIIVYVVSLLILFKINLLSDFRSLFHYD